MRTRKPTDRRPVGRALLAAAMLTAGLALAGGGGSAEAQESAPTLTARVTQRADRVVLRWKFETDSLQRERVLEVERSNGGDFVPAVTRNKPGKTGSVADRTPPEVATTYRARLVVNGSAGAWGPPVTVDAAARTAPPTTTPPTTATPTTPPPSPGIQPCPDSWDTAVANDVNAARRAAGKPPLTVDPKLARAANERGLELAALGRLSHDGYIQAVNGNGYVWSWIGENIHANVSASQVVAGWMGSAPHKANILSTNFDDMGIGCGKDAQGALWWALLLGRGG